GRPAPHPPGPPPRAAAPRGRSLSRQTDEGLGLALLHRLRGKKSVPLNLREPAAVELFRRLCGRADVVVENFLPGTIEQMGLGFPTLQAANPRIVLCSISGFGQTRPYPDCPAFAPLI